MAKILLVEDNEMNRDMLSRIDGIVDFSRAEAAEPDGGQPATP